ncbi:hypothetical protein BTVI_157927 [Pitangus sulphuratus]|nr:hypothetical protein BTVI_157927 [Pitangus sulphuratus]
MERDLRILVDGKLNMNQKCPVYQEGQPCLRGHQAEHRQPIEGDINKYLFQEEILDRSEVFVEPDEKEIDGTHLRYTKFLLCILITALMGISEEVSRSEMSYDLGGLSQLNFKHTFPLISIEVGQERFTRHPGF